jgi:hypothetical protein
MLLPRGSKGLGSRNRARRWGRVGESVSSILVGDKGSSRDPERVVPLNQKRGIRRDETRPDGRSMIWSETGAHLVSVKSSLWKLGCEAAG